MNGSPTTAAQRNDVERVIRFPGVGGGLMGVTQALAALLLNAPGNAQRNAVSILLVTGPSGGEGSSTVALNLAHTIAEQYIRQVCVVRVQDARATDASGVPASKGEPAPLETPMHGAARSGPQVLVLPLARGRFLSAVETDLQGALAAAAPQARLFIIDAPALLNSVEAFMACGQADGVLLVAEANRTTPQQIEAVRATIARAGGHLFGAVLNKRRYRLPAFIARLLGIRTRAD